MNTLDLATFSKHIGSAFRCQLNGGEPVDLELTAAEPLATSHDPNRDPELRCEPYSLVFRGPKDFHLPQQIFPLQHDQLGSLEIFLVPIGPSEDGAGMQYEAVFN